MHDTFNRKLLRNTLLVSSASKALATSCMVVVLVACQNETSRVKMAEVLRHENGLIVKRPKALTAQKTANGFSMTTTEVVRSPLTIDIGVLPEGEQPDIAPSWFGLLGYRYRIKSYEGGSGGAEYSLAAMQPLQDCWLVLSASYQSEYGSPSFLEAWAVIDYATSTADLTC